MSDRALPAARPQAPTGEAHPKADTSPAAGVAGTANAANAAGMAGTASVVNAAGMPPKADVAVAPGTPPKAGAAGAAGTPPQPPASPLRIAFMGTPDFALPALCALLDDPRQRYQVVLAISRPDAHAGRGQHLSPSAVSLEAQARGIELLKPASLAGAEGQAVQQRLQELDLDFIVEVAYGLIIPDAIISTPRYDSVNIHASLLPRWRGAAPIERAILAGDQTTGVTIQAVSVELDAGPTYAAQTVQIGEKTSAGLSPELAELGARMLVECLPQIASGQLTGRPQDPACITYAEKVRKDELRLSPQLSVAENLRCVQASGQHAAAHCRVAERGIRVIAARRLTAGLSAAGLGLVAGQAAFWQKHLVLQAADGAFEVQELAPDGKKAMSAAQFACGVPGFTASAAATATTNSVAAATAAAANAAAAGTAAATPAPSVHPVAWS